ncbi:hypothetical protein K7432_010176 [Basidiobolus ranarum]|uniref:Uncharacterized protein n=1 Tax=Basidiobolus ranarum TaxID=34480 RepID=A0ABR2WP64_9FUNG
MFCVFSYCFRREFEETSKNERHLKFSEINPFDHRILGVVSLNGDYQVPEHVDSKVHHLKNGTRMCVLVKSGKDQFVGYQEEDPFRSLVRFPMELCRTDPNWLAKKWAQISQDSGYEEENTAENNKTNEVVLYEASIMKLPNSLQKENGSTSVLVN